MMAAYSVGVWHTERLSNLEDLVRRGEFIQAALEARRLLMLPELTPSQRGRVYRLLGRAQSESGDPYSGQRALQLAIPLALRAKDWDCLGKARAELGIANLAAGDLANATEYLEAYLLDYQRYDSAKAFLGNVLYNLGLAYRRRKNHSRAIENYRAAVDWFTERGYVLQAGETHQNLAWLYCMQGDAENARLEIDIAESFADVCGVEFRVEQLLCRAFLHTIQKEIGTGMQLVQEILKDGRPGCTDSQRAAACWIAGKCALAAHNLDTAQAFAEFASKYALAVVDTGTMSLASYLKAEIARRREGSDEAVG